MRLHNNESEFEIFFDNRPYMVPNGEFDTNDDDLGNFILKKANFWKKDVRILAGTPKKAVTAVKKVEKPVAEEIPVEVVKETPKKK